MERLKFLILDIIACERKPTEDEILELNLLFFRIGDEADICFIQRYKILFKDLENLRNIILSKATSHIASSVAKKYLEQFNCEVQIHNSYFGRRNQNPPPSLLRKRNRNNAKNFRNRKRFLGVGYKDHGTMKNIATDGSPTWQEVAMDERFREPIEQMEYDPHLEAIYKRFRRFWEKYFE